VTPRILVPALAFLCACGPEVEPDQDELPTQLEPEPPDILEVLKGLPGVLSVTEDESRAWFPRTARWFDLEIEQLVNHDDPQGPRFPQSVSVFFRKLGDPVVLELAGYDIPPFPIFSEPTVILAANQVLIEHRYFNESVPETMDWASLDIRQAAEDHHRIIGLLRPVLGDGKWLSTGGSKGGMTALYHRMFHGEDVDATFAYVAPNSYGVADERYVAFSELP
jgi:hypothetical protein